MAGDDADKLLKEEVDEDYEPTEKEIRDYAEWIGIDLVRDPDCIWIARRGLKTPLPKPWKPCESGDGEIFYFNPDSGDSTWDHPCDEQLRKLYRQERAKKSGTPLVDSEGESSDNKSKKDKKEKKVQRKRNVPPKPPTFVANKSSSSSAPPPPPPMAPGSPAPLSAPVSLTQSGEAKDSVSPSAAASNGSGGGGLKLAPVSSSNMLGQLLGPLSNLPPLSLPGTGNGGALPGPGNGKTSEKADDSPKGAAAAAGKSETASSQVKTEVVEDQVESIGELDSIDSLIVVDEVPEAKQEEEADVSAISVAKEKDGELGAAASPDKVESFNASGSSDDGTIPSPGIQRLMNRRSSTPAADEDDEPISPKLAGRQKASAGAWDSPATTSTEPPPPPPSTMPPVGALSPKVVANSELGSLKLAPKLEPLSSPTKSDEPYELEPLSGIDDQDDPGQDDNWPDSPMLPVAAVPTTAVTVAALDAKSKAEIEAAAKEKAEAEKKAQATEAQVKAADVQAKAAEAQMKVQTHENSRLQRELVELRDVREKGRVALTQAEAERDRLLVGQSDLTNSASEARRLRHLEEKKTTEAREECERLRKELRTLEVEATGKRGRVEEELRKVRAEQQASVATTQAELRAEAAAKDQQSSELKRALTELAEERKRQQEAEAACQRHKQDVHGLRAELDRQRSSNSKNRSREGILSPPPPIPSIDFDSPPTPQLASILVAELRPEESKVHSIEVYQLEPTDAELSLWSQAEDGQKDVLGNSAATWCGDRGKAPGPDNEGNSDSLELSSLSAVLELEPWELDESFTITEELGRASKGKDSGRKNFNFKQSPGKQRLSPSSARRQESQTSKGSNDENAALQKARDELVAKGKECDRLRAEAVSQSRVAAEELQTLRTKLQEENVKKQAQHSHQKGWHDNTTAGHAGLPFSMKIPTPAVLASDAPTANSSPAATLEADALDKCFGSTVKNFNPGANSNIDKRKEEAADLIKPVTLKTAWANQGVVEEGHAADLERLTREAQTLRDDSGNYQRLLQDARASLQREQDAHAATRAAARNSQREAMTLKGKLEGKDAEVERTVAEVQRCHAEISDRDVEIHQLRLQLQAREAELGQLRLQRRAQTQVSDAALQRHRFELGEREQALNERERLLDERERLTSEVEVLMSGQRRELRADKQRIELMSLRATAAELAIPVTTTAAAPTSANAGNGASGTPQRRRSVDATTTRPRRSSSTQLTGGATAVGSRARGSSADCKHVSSKRFEDPCPSDDSMFPRVQALTPGYASSSESSPVDARNQAVSPAGRLQFTDFASLSKKSTKELADVLRSRRKELRSEHADLEEERRRWQGEARQFRKSSSSGRIVSKDIVGKDPATMLPSELSDVRAALDQRAQDLNRAISDQRALEQLFADRQNERKAIKSSDRAASTDCYSVSRTSKSDGNHASGRLVRAPIGGA